MENNFIFTIARVLNTIPSLISQDSLKNYQRKYPDSYSLMCEQIAQLTIEKILEKENEK